MGRKLDSVKNKSREGTDSFRETDQISKKAVSDVKQMKGLIDSLPSDVDDEIIQAAETVKEGTKSDAEGYMNSEVNSRVEQGKRTMEESSQEAQEQIRNNERASQIFSQMDSVGSFGRSARDTGRGNIDRSTQEFNNAINENTQSVQQAEQAFQQDLNEISGTF